MLHPFFLYLYDLLWHFTIYLIADEIHSFSFGRKLYRKSTETKANDVILLNVFSSFFPGVFSSANAQTTQKAFAQNYFDWKISEMKGAWMYFYLDFLLISKSAIKYKRNWSERRNVFVLFFSTPVWFNHFFPCHPSAHTNQQ